MNTGQRRFLEVRSSEYIARRPAGKPGWRRAAATPRGRDRPIGTRNVVWARKASYGKLIYYALVRRPARAATILSRSNTVTVARAASIPLALYSITAHGTHTSAADTHASHADENPLIADRSPWQRSIYTVSMIGRGAAVAVRSLFRGARGYLRTVGHLSAKGMHWPRRRLSLRPLRPSTPIVSPWSACRGLFAAPGRRRVPPLAREKYDL